jgi:hypothetical protein
MKKHPRKLKNRNNPKQMAGKAKGSMDSGSIQVAINHEVSEGTKASGASDSNILGSDAVIHPRRKRTYMFVSRNSKVQFNKAGSSATFTSKTSEVTDSSTAKTLSISGPDFNKHAGVEKQPTSAQEDHNSSLSRRVPLIELNSAGPQFRTQMSKKPQKRGLLKSPGSRELASLFRNEASPVLQLSRRRRNMSNVRVLFSQSMGKETIKMQTKVVFNTLVIHIKPVFRGLLMVPTF